MAILLVEDNFDVREVTKNILELNGYDVIEACNGAEGLKALNENDIKLIISDIDMPVMDGDEFFVRIRADHDAKSLIPFIFVSGKMADQGVEIRLESGAQHVLQKPVAGALLTAAVKSSLSHTDRLSEFLSYKLKDIQGASSSITQLLQTEPIDISVLIDILQLNSNAKNTFSDEYVPNNLAQNTDDIAAQKTRRQELVNLALRSLGGLKHLIGDNVNDALNWRIILTIAETEFRGRPTYASDLYHISDSAKSTVINRLVALSQKGVIEKNPETLDGRRQRVSLTIDFNNRLFNALDQISTIMR